MEKIKISPNENNDLKFMSELGELDPNNIQNNGIEITEEDGNIMKPKEKLEYFTE